MLEHDNIKIFLQKITVQIGLKKLLWLKVKNTMQWTYVINDLDGEEIFGTYYENQWQKTNQKKFIIEKLIKRNGGKLYVK